MDQNTQTASSAGLESSGPDYFLSMRNWVWVVDRCTYSVPKREHHNFSGYGPSRLEYFLSTEELAYLCLNLKSHKYLPFSSLDILLLLKSNFIHILWCCCLKFEGLTWNTFLENLIQTSQTRLWSQPKPNSNGWRQKQLGKNRSSIWGVFIWNL